MFKNSDEFSSVFFVYFLSRENPNCYLYPVKFLMLNPTTVTRDNKVLSEIRPFSNVHMCIIYTKFKYSIGR